MVRRQRRRLLHQANIAFRDVPLGQDLIVPSASLDALEAVAQRIEHRRVALAHDHAVLIARSPRCTGQDRASERQFGNRLRQVIGKWPIDKCDLGDFLS